MNINHAFNLLPQQDLQSSFASWRGEYSYSNQTPHYHRSESERYLSRASDGIFSDPNSQLLFPYHPLFLNQSRYNSTYSPRPYQSFQPNQPSGYQLNSNNNHINKVAAWNAYTTQSTLEDPFPISEIKMTDAQNILTQKYCKIYDINALQELEVIINSCAPNIGSLCSDKEELGTCVRISCNLIITARHVVVENLINELFLFFPKNGWSQLEYVVEESEDQDYVIIQFKPSSGILVSTYPGLSQEKYSQSLLLHTKGQTLQGSVASHIDTGQYYSFAQQGYHESNSGSSGGGYFTSNGYLIAIHRGRETGLGETYGEAISLKEIIGKNENSIIAQFINNNLSQKEEHRFSCEAIYLYPAPRKNPLLDEEGLKSKKILMKLLGDKFYTDKEIKKTKKNEISFAKPEYIENTLERYPEYNDSFNEMCYYQYGLHSKSSDYSANGFIESDHLIPYDVWCSTTNSNMRKLFKYATQQQRKGKRPGERFLPAITISYETHRKLLTTGNSEDSRAFRQKLQDLCDSGNVKDAIIACFLDYQDKKIEIPQAKALGLLSLYNKMKSEGDEQIILLSPNDITTIIQELYPKKPLRRSSAKRA